MVDEPDIYDGPLDVAPSSRCASCGKCCLHMPGGYMPADLGDDWEAKAYELLLTGRVAIDWWEDEKQIFFLRPATVDRVGRTFDPSWGGVCTFLGPAGCELAREDRPTVCKSLEPSPDPGISCSRGVSKWQLVSAWKPFSDRLHEIGEAVQLERAKRHG